MAAMGDLLDLGVVDLIHALTAGDATVVEVVGACLERIAATDGEIGAWAHVDPSAALADARSRDEDRRAGRPMGPLHGIPVGIKDIVDVAGMPTTNGGPPFAHSRPAHDAALVTRLRGAGAVILGKTVATPFAYRDPAATRNPWALDHTPGGSSSGSAAAVAAGHVPVAIGTQTIGSILRPAAFCGVVGLKGDHGDVPLDGVLPLSPSLDHAGPIARSVLDVALVGQVLRARNIDAASVDRPRLVAPPELLDLAEPRSRSRVERAVAALEDAGATVVREPIPEPLEPVLAAGAVILEAEAARQHASWFENHADEYPPMMSSLVSAGLGRSPAEAAAAQRTRAAFRLSIAPWLASFDALVSPVAPSAAPLLGRGTGDPTLCAPWSYAGIPAMSIPTGLDDDGLPLAIQLVAAPGTIDRLVSTAAWCEARFGFDARPPSARQ
jgi:Asp-tRNA(Asn)/Glu-tRNA(Gln) amidotransferase A subunit family amidase